MDILGDFFGYKPASQQARAAEAQRQLAGTEWDHVIRDGRVYLNAEDMSNLFAKVSRLLMLRGILTHDQTALGAAKGMDTASSVLGDLTSELLRRETDAIAKASFGDLGDNGAS